VTIDGKSLRVIELGRCPRLQNVHVRCSSEEALSCALQNHVVCLVHTSSALCCFRCLICAGRARALCAALGSSQVCEDNRRTAHIWYDLSSEAR
jgi:hypothetical protein